MHPILKDKTSLALYLFGWALIGLLVASVVAGRDLELWPAAAALAVPLTVVYAFVSMASWYVCLANPVPRTPVARVVGSQLIAALLSTGLLLLMGRGWAGFLSRIAPVAEGETLFGAHRPLFFAAGILLYLLAATLGYLLLAFEASRKARQQALELQVLAREAELQAFRTQIDPHFLFNCLNSISSLCGSDPPAARHAAVRLGDFLRASLRLGADDTIPLEQELELSAAYLDVERVRFGERLRYRQTVDDDCLRARVPALLLQPLLENALKHGIAHLVEGGEIALGCRRNGAGLAISIRNSRDPDRPDERGTGIGLANVRGRLELLYGGRASLVTSVDGSSFQVEILLPLEPAAATEATRG